MTAAATIGLGQSGAVHHPSVLSRLEIEFVRGLFVDRTRPGRRLLPDDLEPVAELIAPSGAVGRIAAGVLGVSAKPVRALLLDKNDHANWRLGWHQDRTIAVGDRVEVAGFGPWTIKAGRLHVQPPHEVTEALVTLRVHADDVDEQNAPLKVLPGSHLLGRLSNAEVNELAGELEPLTCLAHAGDVWAYSTPIVHRSDEQRRPGNRRVLQLDYAATALPGGLEWAL